MAEISWGTKRTCAGCFARFYDLRKSPPVCPKCGTILEMHTSSKAKRSKGGIKESVLPIDDFDLNLVDAIDVVSVEDDAAILEDEDSIDQGLGGIPGIDEDVA